MAKDDNHNGGILTALVAGVFGVVAGAAAVFFSNKDNREKVEKSVKDIVKKGQREVGKIHGSLEDLSEEAKHKLAQELEKTSKKLSK